METPQRRTGLRVQAGWECSLLRETEPGRASWHGTSLRRCQGYSSSENDCKNSGSWTFSYVCSLSLVLQVTQPSKEPKDKVVPREWGSVGDGSPSRKEHKVIMDKDRTPRLRRGGGRGRAIGKSPEIRQALWATCSCLMVTSQRRGWASGWL